MLLLYRTWIMHMVKSVTKDAVVIADSVDIRVLENDQGGSGKWIRWESGKVGQNIFLLENPIFEIIL